MVVELQWGELKRLAEATGRSKPHIWYVMHGERRPGPELALRISTFLDRPIAELFPGLPPVTPEAAGEAQVQEA